MPTITAAMVNELRAKTGQGMMECKKALTETDGDFDKAVEYFRKKGVKTSITERTASEGRLQVGTSADKKVGAIVMVNCNTDFSAKSEPVGKILKIAIEKMLANPGTNVADDSDVKAAVTDASQQVGENVQIGRAETLPAPEGGAVGTYVYVATGKIGALMAFKGQPSEDLIKNLGGHIAFLKPLGLTRDSVPADLVAKEKEIAVEQAKATGKPQAIAEKIAEGKMNSFFAERVLPDQEFFNAGVFKGTVAKYLESNRVELVKYVLVEVGK